MKNKFEKRKPKKLEGIDKSKISDSIERDVSIDRTKLDFENAVHPRIHRKYTKKYIKALQDKIKSESAFNAAKALMAEHIRKHPKQYGINGKPTDTSLKMALPLHEDYEEAENEYLKAYTKYKEMELVMYTINQRSHVLTNLGKLVEIAYFTPTSMTVDDWEGEME